MTPQTAFMIDAVIRNDRLQALRDSLESLNLRPGLADPDNPMIPFGQL